MRSTSGWNERALNSDPATALEQTQRVGIEISAVAAGQDYLLDNISNTLTVATADAAVAKRLFIFLGLPGGLLAAMLAAYAGSVLAEAERREHATLRVRGAGRRHLLQMLALHTALLTAVGAVVGIVLGYLAAASLLGRESLTRASTTSLVASGIIGAAAGFAAAGLALYVTGHRSIQRQINDDRAQLAQRAPFWRRAGLDVIVLAVVVTATIAAIRTSAFDGAAGSVYFGRAVQLDVMLLVLPLGVWLAGTLLAARLVVTVLTRIAPQSAGAMAPPLRNLYQRSIGRRPWPIGNGTIIIALVVALSTTLTAFTSSYDAAKTNDARYTLGADIRITPAPTAATPYTLDRADLFAVDGIQHITPVIYGLSNVILASARTSDPANLAAIDPATYPQVASSDAPAFTPATLLDTLVTDDHALLLSTDMASFLQADIGDRLDVLLARATDQQIAVRFRVTGLYERLPGFPDGADAVISIQQHTTDVPTKTPDFFLATTTGSDAQLNQAVDALRRGPGAKGDIQIETRIDTLARDQSSLAALNIGGLVDLDNAFSLLIAATAASIFVFGLLLQRRREFITLRALGLAPNSLRRLIIAEASTVAITGIVAGLAIGTTMGLFFVTILRPLFVLPPPYVMPPRLLLAPILLVIAATIVSSITASLLLGRLQPTELLRDE